MISRSVRALAALMAAVLMGGMLAALTSAPSVALGTGRWDNTPHHDFAAMPHRCRVDDQFFEPTSICHVTNYGPSAPVVVAWGDSHMWMYLPALREAAHATHTDLIVMFAGGCPPVLPEPKTAQRGWTGCETHDEERLRFLGHLKADGRHVQLLIGAWWEGYRALHREVQTDPDADVEPWLARMAQIAHDDTKPLFDLLGKYRVATDVMAQPAVVPYDAPACAAGTDPYQCRLRRSDAIGDRAENRSWARRQMTGLTIRPHWIDTSTRNCTAQYCRPRVDGRTVYYDDNHYGATYTRLLTRYFLPTFRRAATR